MKSSGRVEAEGRGSLAMRPSFFMRERIGTRTAVYAVQEPLNRTPRMGHAVRLREPQLYVGETTSEAPILEDDSQRVVGSTHEQHFHLRQWLAHAHPVSAGSH